jgi:DNA-binding response OmpR family regulator
MPIKLDRSKKKILVIDDEERIRRLYSEVLVPEGFEVLEAANATDATRIMIRSSIDLILLDIKMTELDGTQMYEVIREYDPELKVIVSSIFPEDEQKQSIVDADDYFEKSQTMEVLVGKVKEILLR